ncbi:MAG: hypothetical protein GXO07_04890 [Crenarchaeota archaeon]|nr:hypothetical protein [Thermoproteota archaeon]
MDVTLVTLGVAAVTLILVAYLTLSVLPALAKFNDIATALDYLNNTMISTNEKLNTIALQLNATNTNLERLNSVVINNTELSARYLPKIYDVLNQTHATVQSARRLAASLSNRIDLLISKINIINSTISSKLNALSAKLEQNSEEIKGLLANATSAVLAGLNETKKALQAVGSRLEALGNDIKNLSNITLENNMILLNISRKVDMYKNMTLEMTRRIEAVYLELKGVNSSLNATLLDVRAALEELRAKLRSLEALKNETRAQIELLNSEIKSLKRQLNETVKVQVERAKADLLRELRAGVAELQDRVSALEARQRALEGTLGTIMMLQVVPVLTLIVSIATLYLIWTA